MTFAHQQLRSYVDRVLRLKKDQDDLAADIKEVYAEAKAMGFDKTVMGQLVAHLRKRERDPSKFEERSAIFDLYLEAYEQHGTDLATRAHAHEAEPAHDPTTGEILEPSSVPSDDEAGQGEGWTLPSSVAPPINPVAKATEVEPGNAGGKASVRPHNDRAGVASRSAGGRSPAGEGAELPSDDAPRLVSPSVPAVPLVVTDAPGSSPGPDPVETPGAIHSGEMPDLPAFLDRREKAA